MNVYIVTAYRWGNKEAHSYVVGAFDVKEVAVNQANYEKEYRGGKYECEVICIGLNTVFATKKYYDVVYKTVSHSNEKWI